MRKLSIFTAMLLLAGFVGAQPASEQGLRAIQLRSPDMNRRGTMMEALANRQAIREWNNRMLTDQDLSDLLWAAFGINRPTEGMRTAPSGGNSQDIDIYVVMAQGVYIYNAQRHSLEPVAAGDYRARIIPRQDNVATAPVNLVLVSDTSRFPQVGASDEVRTFMSATHAGLVAQNIGLFCASAGLATVITGAFIHTPAEFREVLKLTPQQRIMLNMPVGYPR